MAKVVCRGRTLVVRSNLWPNGSSSPKLLTASGVFKSVFLARTATAGIWAAELYLLSPPVFVYFRKPVCRRFDEIMGGRRDFYRATEPKCGVKSSLYLLLMEVPIYITRLHFHTVWPKCHTSVLTVFRTVTLGQARQWRIIRLLLVTSVGSSVNRNMVVAFSNGHKCVIC